MADAGHVVQVVAGRGQQFDSRVPLTTFPLLDSVHPHILALKAQLDAGTLPPGFDDMVSGITAFLTETLRSSDILIAHNVCSLHKNLALTAAIRRLADSRKGLRLILWHHDLAWTTPRYRAQLHEGFPWHLLKQVWHGAIQVAISDQRQKELAELLQVEKSQIAVVPNGIEPAQFLKLEQQTRGYVRQLGLQEALPLLLLPVRITPRKNIELALRVLDRLRRDFPRAKLLVTGPLGPHNPANADYLLRLIALRAELKLNRAAHFMAELTIESLPDQVISDFYALADALFLPSREEGFGLPILEAGLARLPIICSDIPSLRALGESHATYFSPDADPEHVASLVAERLHASRAFRLHATVKGRYMWERVYSEKIAPLLR
jgi:glycosyltransferase involved in cell wall biosynthesis